MMSNWANQAEVDFAKWLVQSQSEQSDAVCKEKHSDDNNHDHDHDHGEMFLSRDDDQMMDLGMDGIAMDLGMDGIGGCNGSC